jgi:hypothetical protein
MGKGRKKKHQQTSIYKKIKIIEKLQSQQESATDLLARTKTQEKMISSLKAQNKLMQIRLDKQAKKENMLKLQQHYQAEVAKQLKQPIPDATLVRKKVGEEVEKLKGQMAEQMDMLRIDKQILKEDKQKLVKKLNQKVMENKDFKKRAKDSAALIEQLKAQEIS